MKSLAIIWICFTAICASAQINLRGWLGPINPDGLTTNSGSYGQVISKTGGNMKWIDNGVGGGISSDTATNIAAYQAYLATNGISPGGGSQTPITQDVDYAGFSATNMASLLVGTIVVGDGASGSIIVGDTGINPAGVTANAFSGSFYGDGSGLTGTPTFGSVSIGVVSSLGSDGSASFASGNCTIDGSTGKITATGVVDPPMYLLDCISQADALQIYANQVPTGKQTGLALWFNGTNLMAFRGSTGEAWMISMTPSGKITLPKVQPRPVRTNSVHKRIP